MEFAIKLLIQAPFRCIVLSFITILHVRIFSNRDIIIDHVNGLVLDRRVKNLKGSSFETIECVLLRCTLFKKFAIVVFTLNEVRKDQDLKADEADYTYLLHRPLKVTDRFILNRSCRTDTTLCFLESLSDKNKKLDRYSTLSHSNCCRLIKLDSGSSVLIYLIGMSEYV